MTLFLVDASHYQSGLKVGSLRGQGFVGVILKATEGRGWVDPSFTSQLAVAQASGLLAAAYHYLDPPSAVPLDAQARHTAAVVPGDVPVWVDAEGSTTRDHAYAYADALRAAGGKVGGIYHGAQPAPGYGGWWRPAYFGDPTGTAPVAYAAQGGDAGAGWSAGQTRHPDIWQFCQHGRVAGYSGDVDLDAYRGTLDQLASSGWFWVPPDLRGGDMPTADEIAAAVYEKFRTTNVTGPTGEADPQSRSATLLELALVADRHGYATEQKLDRLGTAVGQLAAAVAALPDLHSDVDEAALAAQIVALLPDSIAQQVLDGLHDRLAS